MTKKIVKDEVLSAEKVSSEAIEDTPSIISSNRKKLEEMRKKDERLVKGVFKFYEVPKGSIRFPFKKYKETPLKWYTLKDGETYQLPYGIAKHLNESGWYPIHQYHQNEDGTKSVKIGQKIRRYGFHNVDFDFEDAEAEQRIVTVERI